MFSQDHPPSILETNDLSRYFEGLKAVDGVSFKIQPLKRSSGLSQDDTQTRKGYFHSIIGPNGAGKTTFLNLLSGALHPTRGKIFYKGQDITNLPPYRRAHLGIGRSYQITNVFPSLTVLENVRLAAQALGKDNFKMFTHYNNFTSYEEKALDALVRVGLALQASQSVLSLPHGDKRRLELAMLLAQDPEVLLLDEPTAGLATEQVPGFMRLVKEICEQGDKTVVLVEHNMNVVMSLSDRISVMHQGRLLAEGNPTEIAANQTVQSAYLGNLYGDLSEMPVSRQ